MFAQRLFITSFTTLAWVASAWADPAASRDLKDIPPAMFALRTHVVELFPYASSLEAFSKPSDQKKIQAHLDALALGSQSLTQHARLQTEGFKIPAQDIQNELQQAARFFKQGHTAFAWKKYRSALHGCSSCHTQVGHKKAPRWDIDFSQSKASMVEEADFLFTLRDYAQAQERYELAVKQAATQNLKDRDVERALKRVLTIALHIERSPKNAQAFLNRVLALPSLPGWMLIEVQRWLKELNYLQTLKVPSDKESRTDVVERFTDSLLRDVYPFPKAGRSREVAAMFASGVILEFMNRHPDKLSPGLLLWAGTVLDNADQDLFLASGDAYLKRCIELFPKDPRSLACLHALKERWALGFTGSVGGDMPDDLAKQIQELENLQQKFPAK